MTAVFTGHRPHKLGGFDLPNSTYDFVYDSVLKILMERQPDRAISGMALGFDQWAAQVCVDLGVPFVAAVPFKGFEARWPEESQSRFKELLSKAYHVAYVCDGPYKPWFMQERNKWMVDHLVSQDDFLLSCWDGSSGGTRNTIRYSEARRAKVGYSWVNIHPITKMLTSSALGIQSSAR